MLYKILLLINIVLLTVSCQSFNFHQYETDKIISQNIDNISSYPFSFGNMLIGEQRKPYIDKLYKEINDITEIDDAETIVKLDLLKLISDEKQFDYCPISTINLVIWKKDITSNEYQAFMQNLYNKIKTYYPSNKLILEHLEQNINQKLNAYKKLVQKIDIDDNYGGISEINRLINQAFNDNISYLLDNKFRQKNIEELNHKIEILSKVSYLISKLPIMEPMPGAKIISKYGKRMNPFTEKYELHDSIRYHNRTNSYVYSTGEGQVIHAGALENSGFTIIIDHGNGITSHYHNLQYPFLVREGENVAIMQKIGLQGTSGTSFTDHLNYQIKINNKPVNPNIFLKLGWKCHYGYKVPSMFSHL